MSTAYNYFNAYDCQITYRIRLSAGVFLQDNLWFKSIGWFMEYQIWQRAAVLFYPRELKDLGKVQGNQMRAQISYVSSQYSIF